MNKGLFITLEGGEGAGKSTQGKALCAWLNQQGVETILTREPGGTAEAEAIRDLIVKSNHLHFDVKTEALLMMAARREHVLNKIKPALNKGICVISDRFFDSTLAYQGYAGGIALDDLKMLYDFIASDLTPDLTFVFDLPTALGLERSLHKLSQAENAEKNEDRFEKRASAFHEKIRDGFLKIAAQNPHRYHVLDATQSAITLEKEIQHIVQASLTPRQRQDQSHG